MSFKSILQESAGYRFTIDCVSSCAADIGPMVDQADEINFREFRRYVDQDEIDRVFPFYLDVPGLSIDTDYHVTFWESEYRGRHCVFIVHSAIEYVFTKSGVR